jgi:hypothetical protein
MVSSRLTAHAQTRALNQKSIAPTNILCHLLFYAEGKTPNDMIPDDVTQFIQEKIDSIAQLEALLLLRSEPNGTWSSSTLAQRLYTGEQETVDALERLCADGLTIASGSNPTVYRYEPVSQELRDLVDRTADVYSKHLVPITNLIHTKPKTRVQEFADAFKIRKDEK